jgi:acetyl-CoA carboxylase biotin carboxylase subunit
MAIAPHVAGKIVVDTTVPLFHALLDEQDVLTGDYNIHWLEHWLETNLGNA